MFLSVFAVFVVGRRDTECGTYSLGRTFVQAVCGCFVADMLGGGLVLFFSI